MLIRVRIVFLVSTGSDDGGGCGWYGTLGKQFGVANIFPCQLCVLCFSLLASGLQQPSILVANQMELRFSSTVITHMSPPCGYLRAKLLDCDNHRELILRYGAF